MKRRYLAMVLGLVLAIAPMSAFAEEAENIAVEAVTEPADEELIAVEEIAEDGQEEGAEDGAPDEAAEMKNQFWGKVTAVDDTSITISVGTLGGDEMPGGPGSEPGEAPADFEMTGEEAEDGAAAGMEMTGEEGTNAEVSSDEEGTNAEMSSDEEGTDAEAASDEEAADEEGTAAATGEGANVEAPAEGDNEMPEEMSAYEALELTGEEMTIAITDDTEVYFVYGDTDIAALKMTAWDYANQNGEFVFEITEEDAAGGEVLEEGTEENADNENTLTDAESVADLEENAEAGAEEGAEADSEEFAEGTDTKSAAGEMNKMVSLTVESAAAESIIADDLVNITLDEDGNAAVILIVMPEAEA